MENIGTPERVAARLRPPEGKIMGLGITRCSGSPLPEIDADESPRALVKVFLRKVEMDNSDSLVFISSDKTNERNTSKDS